MLKTKITLYPKRIFAALIVALFAVQVIAPLSVANAVAITPTESGTFDKVEDLAYSWQAYYYFLGCSDSNNGKTSISGDDVTSYTWFKGSDWDNSGHVLGGDDGKAPCNNGEQWLSKAVTLWGFGGDAGGFLRSTGYEDNNNDGTYEFSGRLAGGTGAECGDREECFRTFINQLYGKGTNANYLGNPPAAETYYLAFTNFTIGCSASQQKLWSAATADEKAQARGDNNKSYLVKLVNDKGEVEEWLFTADKPRGEEIITGPGLPDIGNFNKTAMRCDELTDRINNSVAGYATYVLAAKAAGVTPPISNDPEANSKDDPNASCEAEVEMGWIICPIARTADKFASWVQGIVVGLLRINDTPDAYKGIKEGWGQIRVISSGLIVLVAVIMVASQIFSFEFMSAYTMKKVLPRLVIAAILIQLSWFIFTGFISLVNALGDGVQAILLSPFPGLANAAFDDPPNTLQYILGTFADSYKGDWVIGPGVVLLAGGALAGFAAIGGMAGLGLAAVGVILACLVAFVTLVLRKVLILALLIIAPLALVAWILPGTQKWWEKWWDMFSKLLFMYPLVIGLITVGQIGAYLAARGGGFASSASIPTFFADVQEQGSQMVVFFIILIAYFGPFFFIPSMFKLGGTVLAKAAGFATKGTDALRKARPIRNLEKARDNNRQRREYDSKARGQKWAQGGGYVGKIPGGRRIGQFQAGRAGVGTRGEFAKQFAAAEEAENMKNAGFEYSSATKGMEFVKQVDDSVKIATARTGSMVELSNGQKVMATEAMQRTSAKFLADTGRSNQLRQVEEELRASGRTQLWNTMQGENAGAITKINPDQVGKKFWDLSATEMSDMKPETFRNMRAAMADPRVSHENKDRIKKQLDELMGNETLRNKLGPEALAHVGAMQRYSTTTPVQRQTVDVSGVQSQVDHLGNTEYRDVKDDNGNYVRTEANPNFRTMRDVRDDDGKVIERRPGW